MLRVARLVVAVVPPILMLLVTAGVAHAKFTTAACLSKKRAAWGNLRKCQATAEAKQLLGKTTDLVTCQTKFNAKLTKIAMQASDAGIACRYADHGDGTVIDYDTGLQWERKAPGTCSTGPIAWVTNDDCSRGTCMGGGNPHFVGDTYNWDDARFFVGATTSNDGSALAGAFAGFAGHSDWRLPTIPELQTILLAPYPCGANPCIDPILGVTAASFYWSSTTVASDPVHDAWSVLFNDGTLVNDGRAFNDHVRAVRGGL